VDKLNKNIIKKYNSIKADRRHYNWTQLKDKDIEKNVKVQIMGDNKGNKRAKNTAKKGRLLNIAKSVKNTVKVGATRTLIRIKKIEKIAAKIEAEVYKESTRNRKKGTKNKNGDTIETKLD